MSRDEERSVARSVMRREGHFAGRVEGAVGSGAMKRIRIGVVGDGLYYEVYPLVSSTWYADLLALALYDR